MRARATHICGPCLGGYHGDVTWADEPDANGFRAYKCNDCGEEWSVADTEPDADVTLRDPSPTQLRQGI